MSSYPRCNNPNCPICYPKRKAEEESARKRAEEDRQDCVTYWLHYQKQAEAIVAVDDPVVRNRRINAAYAKLWLEDHRFQWAGLAAFASKQVGCGLLNAAEMTSKASQQRRSYQDWYRQASLAERMSPYASPRVQMPDQATGAGAYKVYTMLAKGNTALFLDIWPLHMFFKKFGLARFRRCLPERQQIRNLVKWPIANSVPFAARFPQVADGFVAIEAGNAAHGVEQLALHEQLNILQPSMYDDPAFALLMRSNQFAWAVHFPSSSVQEVQLVLANECTVDGTSARRESFSHRPLANLADPAQRMAFVMRAAERFAQLLRDPIERVLVENSLHIIASGGAR